MLSFKAHIQADALMRKSSEGREGANRITTVIQTFLEGCFISRNTVCCMT